MCVYCIKNGLVSTLIAWIRTVLISVVGLGESGPLTVLTVLNTPILYSPLLCWLDSAPNSATDQKKKSLLTKHCILV